MKKLISLLLVGIMVLTLNISVLSASANADITVILDDVELQFDVAPRLIGGRTMVPLRAIFEALGTTVEWDDSTKTVIAYNEAVIVKCTIGSNVMYVNETEKNIDVAPMVVDSRTLVPARFIAESFNCDVTWDENTSTVTILSEKFVDFSNSTDAQEEVRVSTPEQLLNSIGNSKKIILTSNYYNLSTAKNVNNEHVEKQLNWDGTYLNAYIIKNVVNMIIEGNAEIVVDDLSADVLSFEKCGNITLSGLTIGHSTYYEEYTCEGAVTSFYICDGVYINNCNLFGCGAIGVSADSVNNLQVNNSNIYDCTFTGMHLSNTNTTVKNTQFYDSYHWGGFIMLVNSVADFSNCSVHDIKTDPGSIFAFIDIDDYLNSNETKVTFTNCNFYNNSFINLASATAKNITFDNCTLNNNSGNMQHSAVVYNHSNVQTNTNSSTPTEQEYSQFICNYYNDNTTMENGYLTYSMDTHSYQFHIGENLVDAYNYLISNNTYKKDEFEDVFKSIFETMRQLSERWQNETEFFYTEKIIIEVRDPVSDSIIYICNSGEKVYSMFDDKHFESETASSGDKIITEEQKRQIFEIVKKHVSTQLKSPSMAIWPDYTKLWYTYDTEGKISVTGEIEAMNSFGGYGRVNFLFTFNEDLSIDFKYVY